MNITVPVISFNTKIHQSQDLPTRPTKTRGSLLRGSGEVQEVGAELKRRKLQLWLPVGDKRLQRWKRDTYAVKLYRRM